MTNVSGLLPIPWRYVDTDLTQMWEWKTEHFEATITADVNSFGWELGDLVVPNQGLARFLAEGRSSDFATAEREVRETVGKSYPPRFGYAPYAGELATTFTLATGERVNLGEYNGQAIIVTIRLPNGVNKSVVGHARVEHYELHLETHGGSIVKVQPAHIVDVRREGGGTGKAASSDYTGVGRIYRGTPGPGCTGKQGYLPGTIEHEGATCTVHEAGSGPRFAPTRY